MEETLGKRIVTRRKELGLTQDQLAERLGVTAQAVSKWENDQSCPDIAMLPRLAEIFGVSIDSLLGCQPPTKEEAHEAEVISHREESDELESEGLRYQNGKWEFRYDGGRKSSLGIAVWVILVGGLMFASTLLDCNAPFWSLAWQAGLLVFGLFGLYPRFSAFRLGCALFGGYFLLEATGVTSLSISGKLIFPICLLLFGLSLLIDALRRPKKPFFSITHDGKNIHRNSCCNTADKTFECSTAFGENTYSIDLPLLSRGCADVSFGDLTVDLSGVEKVAENCFLEAKCAFGQMTLLVPRKWKVESDSHTAFGVLEFDGQPDPEAQGLIALRGNVSFGQISVKYI